jgi:hypothetical protein
MATHINPTHKEMAKNNTEAWFLSVLEYVGLRRQLMEFHQFQKSGPTAAASFPANPWRDAQF